MTIGRALRGIARTGLAFVVFAVGLPARSQDRPPPVLRDHVVRAGETCASIARTYFGDAHRWDLLHEHNPGMGPPPHRLVPGTVLRVVVVPRDTTGPDARVTASVRRVEARAPSESSWREARRGQALTRGWRVTTHERASAELTFRDTSVLEMRERTLVIVFGPSAREAARRSTTEATLERGALRARLAELAGEGPVAVTTPEVVAELAGGEAVVSVDDVGTSRIANHSGRDAVIVGRGRRRARVRLPPGTGARVSRGSTVIAPRRLLPAPVWSETPADRVAGIAGRGATLRGSWAAVEGAAGYRVELVRGEGGTELVAAIELASSATRFEAHGMPEGVVRVRVSAIDREHLEGPPSDERVVRVIALRVRAPGATTAPAWIDEPTDPSARAATPRVLVGSRIEAPPAITCARAGVVATRASAIRLASPGSTEVLCLSERREPVEPLPIEVVPLRVTVLSQRLLRARGGIPREESIVLRLAIASDVDVPPALRAVSPPGVVVGPLARGTGGAWELRVGALARAPSTATLRFVAEASADADVIASLSLPIAPPRERPRAPHPRRREGEPTRADETWGLLPLRRSIGLRDERAGSGAFATVAVLAAGDDEPDTTTIRAAAGLRLQVFDEPVQLSATLPVELAPASGPSSAVGREGSLDPLVAASWSVIDRRVVGAAIELGVWLPIASGGGLAETLWIPSAEIALRLVPRWTLRARQAAMLDAREDGPRLWLSAYGATVRIAGPFALGAEVALSVGADERETVAEVAPSVSASLHDRLVAFALSARLESGAPAFLFSMSVGATRGRGPRL